MIQTALMPSCESARSAASPLANPELEAECYGITLFTLRWREVREFYVDILRAQVTSEREGRYTEMLLGGLPVCLRQSEAGEAVSFLHLYLAVEQPEVIFTELQRRGIIVTKVGPYTNFRDPEGRVIKLSQSKTIVL